VSLARRCGLLGCGTLRWQLDRPCDEARAGPQDLAITLKADEGKVTGSIAIQGGGESRIEWGMVKGDLIVFKLKMPFQDRTETFVYLGKVEGDRIAFGRRPEDLTLGRLVEFTAVRGK
jgi:hypothetical protein